MEILFCFLSSVDIPVPECISLRLHLIPITAFLYIVSYTMKKHSYFERKWFFGPLCLNVHVFTYVFPLQKPKALGILK